MFFKFMKDEDNDYESEDRYEAETYEIKRLIEEDVLKDT